MMVAWIGLNWGQAFFPLLPAVLFYSPSASSIFDRLSSLPLPRTDFDSKLIKLAVLRAITLLK